MHLSFLTQLKSQTRIVLLGDLPLVVVSGAMVALALAATAIAIIAEKVIFPHHPH